jgi:thiamine pyrophosphokinase
MTNYFETWAIVANGTCENTLETRNLIAPYKNIIGVDGGVRHLYNFGLSPSYFIGDLDSIDPSFLSRFKTCEKVILDKNKDISDLEAAINFAENAGAKKISIFCALGGRTDHLLGNLLLLKKKPLLRVIESTKEEILTVVGEQTFTTTPGKTLSLFALGAPCEKVSTKGLKWELADATISSGYFSLSNETIDSTFTIISPKEPLFLIRHK